MIFSTLTSQLFKKFLFPKFAVHYCLLPMKKVAPHWFLHALFIGIFFLFSGLTIAQNRYLKPNTLVEPSKAQLSFYFQDSQGFLWGTQTEDKIIRFDGYQTQVFLHDPSDSTTQSGCMFYAAGTGFLEDRQGRIWVRSKYGCLDRFDPKTGRFEAVGKRIAEQFGSYGFFRNFMGGADGNIWIASTGKGVFRFDLATEKIVQFQPYRSPVWLIFQDANSDIWV